MMNVDKIVFARIPSGIHSGPAFASFWLVPDSELVFEK